MPDVVLAGGRVLRDGGWVTEDLCLRGPTITGPDPSGGAAHGSGDDADVVEHVDASGLLIAPGLIDLQCNGGLGIDVTTEPARLWELAGALPRWGVTAWLPTVTTAPPGAVDAALAALAAGPPPGWVGAEPVGLHLEGPFLAPAARGAHPAEHLLPPTLDAVAGWTRAAGVAAVTLAPELPGALAVVEALAGAGVVVSLGHSRATAVEARAAVDAGATAVTHLFNAMAPLHHREAGLAGVALADDRLHVGLIADGIHVAPDVVTMAQRLLGDRLVLVSDAVAALAPGRDGRLPVDVRTPGGVLAGSACPLDGAVRNLVRFTGCPPEAALAAASTSPARLLRDRSRGALEPGARADLVLLTPDLELVETWVGGAPVHRAGRPSRHRA